MYSVWILRRGKNTLRPWAKHCEDIPNVVDAMLSASKLLTELGATELRAIHKNVKGVHPSDCLVVEDPLMEFCAAISGKEQSEIDSQIDSPLVPVGVYSIAQA